MITKACGCTAATCGCCEGTRKLTPMSTANRPGLPALSYRVGTHGAFLETMKARLSSMAVDGVEADGQTPKRYLPLQGLTTRDPQDPAVALLDGWATVADVLTFYQELIANEGYLRTATERRSVLELARLVGYALRPGVASTVFLAYNLDDNQPDPVEIPVGTRAQSIPGPGEMPQSFETMEAVVARREWNDLGVRRTQPTLITLANVSSVPRFYVNGTATGLKTGDLVLFMFSDGTNETPVLRTVAKVEAQFADDRTQVDLAPLAKGVVAALAALLQFVTAAKLLVTSAGGPKDLVDEAARLVDLTRLGSGPPAEHWIDDLLNTYDGGLPSPLDGLFVKLEADVKVALGQPPDPTPSVTTDPSRFVLSLLQEPNVQARSSVDLIRDIGESLQAGSDAHPQLLVNFAPQLQDSFYTAWANADLGAAASVHTEDFGATSPPPSLDAAYTFRTTASLFGATVPTPTVDPATGKPPGIELTVADDEDPSALFLEQPRDGILAGSYALIQKREGTGTTLSRVVLPVSTTETVQRLAYTVGGKATRLTFPSPWWKGRSDTIGTLRSTLVHAQTEALVLAEEPLPDAVEAGTRTVALAGLHKELTSGRWVILSGERADIPGVEGVDTSELLMISAVRHDYDPALPGDKIHTTVILATSTAYRYKRTKLTIFGNVAKATHGETRNETLGNGDGSQTRQTFELKQPPLTFVPAPTPSGVTSTLTLFVNDIEWHEAETLAGAGPTDRSFVTKTDDDARTTVIFGNGREGSRLPTGTENVKSVYRNGIGKPGNVAARQISMLVTKPLGVKSVVNPMRASGGSDREGRDQARENAPLTTMALDRVVSVQDYADFTRTFAGIGKAQARRLSDGHRELVHLTIAGVDDIPIDTTGDLYLNLLTALRRYGDPDVPLEVQLREVLVLVVSAKVRAAPDYRWEPVATRVRAALLDAFGFERRSLGQPALLCEVIGAIQNVEGVAWVDVDAFGGIPEKTFDPSLNGRRLLTLDELAEAARRIVNPTPDRTKGAPPAKVRPGPEERVDANVAAFEGGVLRPAQLAIALPAVNDTIVINQVGSRP